uniref:Transposase n=1 Tax=Heterorhabditis bacteriophora TaxID=37862 RepID=A0A1I7WQ86_HETBA
MDEEVFLVVLVQDSRCRKTAVARKKKVDGSEWLKRGVFAIIACSSLIREGMRRVFADSVNCDPINTGRPLHDIKRRRMCMKESALSVKIISQWMALVARHVKRHIHALPVCISERLMDSGPI